MKFSDILIIGGTFDNNGGKPSYIVSQLAKHMTSSVMNGGYIHELTSPNSKYSDYSKYKALIWMPNI